MAEEDDFEMLDREEDNSSSSSSDSECSDNASDKDQPINEEESKSKVASLQRTVILVRILLSPSKWGRYSSLHRHLLQPGMDQIGP